MNNKNEWWHGGWLEIREFFRLSDQGRLLWGSDIPINAWGKTRSHPGEGLWGIGWEEIDIISVVSGREKGQRSPGRECSGNRKSEVAGAK